MSKRKVILHLNPKEIAIVQSIEEWEHLVMVYEALSEDAHPDDKPFWVAAAAFIRAEVESNKRVPKDWGE